MIAFTIYASMGWIHPLFRTNHHLNHAITAIRRQCHRIGSRLSPAGDLYTPVVSIICLFTELVYLVHVVIWHSRCERCPGESLKYHLLVVLHHLLYTNETTQATFCVYNCPSNLPVINEGHCLKQCHKENRFDIEVDAGHQCLRQCPTNKNIMLLV